MILSLEMTKVRMGICDEEVIDVLSNLVQPPDVHNIELDRTVVICSTRKECSDINDECIKNVVGEVPGKTSRQTYVESGCPCHP